MGLAWQPDRHGQGDAAELPRRGRSARCGRRCRGRRRAVCSGRSSKVRLQVEDTQGVRVVADLLPAAVLEEDPQAVLEL
ncbi:hypothetical protein AB0C31_49385, partial [Actinoplanes philippinensis]